jgi:hypothetical protein
MTLVRCLRVEKREAWLEVGAMEATPELALALILEPTRLIRGMSQAPLARAEGGVERFIKSVRMHEGKLIIKATDMRWIQHLDPGMTWESVILET